jgi:hypothetical protein
MRVYVDGYKGAGAHDLLAQLQKKGNAVLWQNRPHTHANACPRAVLYIDGVPECNDVPEGAVCVFCDVDSATAVRNGASSAVAAQRDSAAQWQRVFEYVRRGIRVTVV